MTHTLVCFLPISGSDMFPRQMGNLALHQATESRRAAFFNCAILPVLLTFLLPPLSSCLLHLASSSPLSYLVCFLWQAGADPWWIRSTFAVLSGMDYWMMATG
jgi:hypothetical protein